MILAPDRENSTHLRVVKAARQTGPPRVPMQPHGLIGIVADQVLLPSSLSTTVLEESTITSEG